MSPKTTTQFSESLAVKFLQRKGYTIITRNYQYKRFGEIDIIAFYENTFRFVEVKGLFVSEDAFQTTQMPTYNFTAHKIRTIGRIAEHYLQETRQRHQSYVIEGVALVISTHAHRAKVEHLPDLSQGLW